MPLFRPRWPHPLLLLPMLLGGVGTGFLAAVFFLGSESTMADMAHTDGLFLVFLRRWLGFAILGSLLAADTALLSWLGAVCGLGKGWAGPHRVFRLTLGLQLLSTLLGCLVFAYAAQAVGE